jgi:perosamine synthetase
MTPVIPYGRHWLEEDDLAEVLQTLRSGWITQGPKIEEFERRVASACGARFGVAFSNGTVALHAACSAAGIQTGDEVITSPLTFVATANAAVYQGAKPVFADIDEKSLNIDPEQIQRRLTPKTRALLPVHFAGLPADLETISAIARKRDLCVIEDACHALGAEWLDSSGSWQKIGSCSHSDMAILSFHPVKQITTGEGGMVLTNREDLLDRLRAFRHHGLRRPEDELAQAEPWRHEVETIGTNGRLTDFQCALGLSQMAKLGRFLERRRRISDLYAQAWAGFDLVPQSFSRAKFRHAWHLYVVQLGLRTGRVDRRAVYQALVEMGIGVNVHYLPVHLHPVYRRLFSYRPGDYPVAEKYYERALTLPLYPAMTDEQVQKVIQCVDRVLEREGVPHAAR